MPRAEISISRPIALANLAEPSASITILPSVPELLPQAPMTNASLTAMQAMVSTPFALIASAFCTNPGKCLALQVGVKAPGTANSTTFLPLNISSVATSFGPSAVAIISFIDGIASPTLIVMVFSLPERDRPAPGAPVITGESWHDFERESRPRLLHQRWAPHP